MGQGPLVLAFRIHGFGPKLVACFFWKPEQSAGEQGVCGAVGRKDQRDGLKGFAQDERHAVFGRFQNEVTVDAGREAGDDDGCDVLHGQLFFAFRRFADKLPVPAREGALRGVDVDDVEGHAASETQKTCVSGA